MKCNAKKRMDEDETWQCYKCCLLLSAIVLNKKFGYSAKRCENFNEAFNESTEYECLRYDDCSHFALCQKAKEFCGVDVQKLMPYRTRRIVGVQIFLASALLVLLDRRESKATIAAFASEFNLAAHAFGFGFDAAMFDRLDIHAKKFITGYGVTEERTYL